MKPYPYQTEGAHWLVGKRFALLADEMGLGKSAQVALAADTVGAKRVLIIGPSVSKITWQRELETWCLFPRELQILNLLKDRVKEGCSAVCSFDYAAKNAEHLRDSGPWDLLVIDEVHLLKSADAIRTQKIFGRVGVVRNCKRVWVLSGTPAPNHAGELWVLLYAFGATKLPYDAFVKHFCHSYTFQHRERVTGTKKERVPELKALLAKIMLRRLKMDVLKDLPTLTFSDVFVEPGRVDLDAESSFVQFVFPVDRRKELEEKLAKEQLLLNTAMGMQTDLEIMDNRNSLLQGMAQSISTLRRYNGIQKVEGVAKMVAAELEAGLYDKVVIFAIHRDVIKGLRDRLRKYKPVTLFGGNLPGTKQENVDKFQNRKHVKIFIGNIAAAGTNITLTSAHHVIFAEVDWVPGNNAQAAMRCHRIGQKKNVTVRFVSLANPIDQRVTEVLKRKTLELAKIFD